MNGLPQEVSETANYCVLDYSNQNDVDFHFIPLLMLDAFPRPAADLKIGPYRVMMPLDWSILIADKNFGYIEVIELSKLNDREFDVFVMNPLKSYIPEFHEITIENIFPDYSWSMPRLKFGHVLAVPLRDGECPPCAYFVKDISKLPESLDITKIFT